jgi:hypothetical protein
LLSRTSIHRSAQAILIDESNSATTDLEAAERDAAPTAQQPAGEPDVATDADRETAQGVLVSGEGDAVATRPPTGGGDNGAEPMTMAELMEHPDNEVKSLKHGDVVEGTVVRIDPDEILVDFGGKSEGVVSNR